MYTARFSRRARLAQRLSHAAVRRWVRYTSRPMGWLVAQDMVVRTGNFGSTSWLGTPLWQNVLDLWSIQETIAEVKPTLLVETGTHTGGAAVFYAQLMDLLGTGRVLTIDIVNQHEGVHHPRVSFLDGSSTDPHIVEHVREEAANAGGPVMVILDSDHARDHVAKELELYAPLVTPGSFLLSQDGIIDKLWLFGDSRPGPLQANRAFLEAHPEFEHDRERNHRFGLTHHPLGWMRRRD